MLDAVGALRWSRPDLAASLAEHLMESAEADSDRDGWLAAAGRRVQAHAACGDARDVAAHILESLPRWGRGALAAPAAAGLRLELAVLAHDAGETSASRALLDGVPDGVTEPGLAADVATARLRCSSDGLLDPADALAAWARVGGAAGQIGLAASLLITASADRRRDRPADGVARAVEGLERLDRARLSPRSSSPAPHLAAALSAEWIASLIAAGRSDQASEGSRPLRERLADHARPTRQLALLRLTLTRVAAADGRDPRDVVRELERAAHEAAASDTPQLEVICRTALGEVHDASGRTDAARESARLATVADRRHRARADRLRTALGSLSEPAAGPPVRPGPRPEDLLSVARDRSRAGAASRDADPVERTARLRAVQAASMQAAPTGDPRPPDGGGRRRRREGDPAANGSGTLPTGADDVRRTVGGAATNGHGRVRVPGATPPEASLRVPAPDPWATGLWSAGSPGGGGVRGAAEAGARPSPERNGTGSARSGDTAGADTAGVDAVGVDAAGVDTLGGTGTGTSGADRGSAETAPAAALSGTPGGGDDEAVDGSPAAEPDRAQVSGGGPERPAGDGPAGTAASALADPEAWLASALADLDRIWGRPADEPEPEPPGPAAVRECLVVVDLVRAGARLSADESAPTVRRVARRLAQRLPATGRLRRDSPDAVAVVLADGDRAVAAEWMRRVVPTLVEGLAVDATVQGALLRAAVHDEHGVVGAQVLRRLDGGRGRDATAGIPRPSRRRVDDAPGGVGPVDAGSAHGPAAAFGADRDGLLDGWETVDRTAERDRTGDPDPAGVPEDPTGDRDGIGDGDRTGAPVPVGEPRRDDGSERKGPREGSEAAGVGSDRGTTNGVPDRDAASTRLGDTAAQRRHDDAGGRRPYLPDGVIVRPGSGGRRHRRTEDAAAPGTAPAGDVTADRAASGHDGTGRAGADGAGTDGAGTDGAGAAAAGPDAATYGREGNGHAVTGHAGRDPGTPGPTVTGSVVTTPALDGSATDALAVDGTAADGSGTDGRAPTGSRATDPAGTAPAPPSPGPRRPSPVPRAPAEEEDRGGSSSTDGLGLADLLAGALAAYRGI
ncbi:hypothetical protein [Pseudonocardia hydrocarbonoxydans]|uniref:hypothetical protein n=1 Tax=Pseudonocardia hydrocarbonoxydans TaxID=76726 RepID=UPI001476A1EB|nr:hypothetical protein [Pseudonocardia hydrocarbonoxydans]